jgi:hypothetical protein
MVQEHRPWCEQQANAAHQESRRGEAPVQCGNQKCAWQKQVDETDKVSRMRGARMRGPASRGERSLGDSHHPRQACRVPCKGKPAAGNVRGTSLFPARPRAGPQRCAVPSSLCATLVLAVLGCAWPAGMSTDRHRPFRSPLSRAAASQSLPPLPCSLESVFPVMTWTFAARTFAPAFPPPADPLLAVVDHADGTGGTATVAGAEADAAISVQSWSAAEGASAGWIERGSRVGNGDVLVAPPLGDYWWRAVSATAGGQAVSNLVYQSLTDGSHALLYRILAAVKTRLLGLGLEGIEPPNVQICHLPWERALASVPPALPAVQIAPAEHATALNEGTNRQDDVEYAVQVVLIDTDPRRHPHAHLPRLARWRQRIARAFRSQRLAGVAEVYQCSVEPDTVLHRTAWLREGLLVSALTLRFRSREARQ